MTLDPSRLFHTDIIRSDDSRFFVGREKLIKQALNTLGSKSSSCVIYGERGVGKSSLAWQVASILEDQNPRFSRSRFQRIGGDEQYAVVFLESAGGPQNVSQLLARLITFQGSKNSLREKFSDVYRRWDIDSQIRKDYNIRLSDLVRLHQSPELIGLIFDDLVRMIKTAHPRLQLVFFIDEVDKITEKKGLGDLIKRVDYAKFVLIGIADTVAQILEDHPSAVRKLVGGDIEVEKLSDHSIDEIFKEAQSLSDGKLIFSPTFLARARKLSSGFPWIAQHLGFHALRHAIEANDDEEAEAITLYPRHLTAARATVRKLYQNIVDQNIDFRELSEADSRAVASAVLTSIRALAADDINKIVKGRFDETNIYLQRLCDANILTRRPDKRYRPSDPVFASFVLDEIERLDHGDLEDAH